MNTSFTSKFTLKTTIVVLMLVIVGFFTTKYLLFPKVSVDVSDVVISLPHSDNTVKIGSPQTALISALGKPKQVSGFSSQDDYRQGTVLNYNGAKFYFVHNKLTDFEITSHSYKVGLASDHKFNSIGNTSSDLPHVKIEQNIALLDVKKDDAATDQFLEYDLSDSGKVTKIS